MGAFAVFRRSRSSSKVSSTRGAMIPLSRERGATTGPDVGIGLRHLFGRQLALLGSYMGTMGELYEVLGHVFAGRLKPVVDRVFPLQDTRAAHEHMEKSQMFGKIILHL
jgi:NADPH:quinone reductase-like Zn-dependent oxidoreductase